MHRLLKRQLKKTGAKVDENFLKLVEQTYIDMDEDKKLLERSLELSSAEMLELYSKLEQNAKEKIRRSEERYNKLIAALSDYYFFYAHDLNGIFIYASKSITNILGYSQDEVHKHFKEFLTDDEMNQAAYDVLNSSIDNNQHPPITVSAKHKNGSIRYLEVTSFPVLNDKNEVIEVEGIARDITKHYLANKQLDFISHHDTLTNILNRYSFYEIMQNLIKTKENLKFSILYLDLDHFKEVNDNLGHDVGDTLLQESVKRIQRIIRKDDIFARIGGDEFVVALLESEREHLNTIAKKIVDIISKEFSISKHTINVSASIGIAIYPDNAVEFTKLLKKADEAMYYTKENGKNNFTYFSDILK